MPGGKRRTNMQSLHGKLCASLYRQFGESVLPTIQVTYGEYGREIGSGLKKKWNPDSFEAVMTSFIKMCNDGGMPADVLIEGNIAHVKGTLCPFGLENTDYKVCEAMMAMDLEMLRVLTGEEKLRLRIEKTLAAGDSECKMTYYTEE
jgi:hypothetical protein